MARLPSGPVLAAQGSAFAQALREVPPVAGPPAALPSVSPAICRHPLDGGGAGSAGAAAITTGLPAGDPANRRLHIYLPYWSHWTYAPFAQHCTARDVLMAERYEMSLPGGALTRLDPMAGHQAQITRRIRADIPGMKMLPVLSLSYDPASSAPVDPAATAERLAAAAKADGAAGLCIAPNGFGDAGAGLLDRMLRALSGALKARGLTRCLISAAEDGLWQQPALVAGYDKIVVQAFRTPSTPEPLAPQGWFAAQARALAAAVPPSKLVLALGSFAMDWKAGAPEGEEIPYAEAMRRAARRAAVVHFDPASGNATLDYSDADGAPHRIWMLDAATAFNQLTIAARLGISGIALWPLGEEDPGIWPLLAAPMPLPVEALSSVQLTDYVGYEGQGPFQVVASPMRPGTRQVTLDPCTGLITAARYTVPPRPYTILRFGRADPKKIALTFDDGPDPNYTPKILDELLAAKAPGAFFMVGEAMLGAPGVVARAAQEGFEIGSHTFLHGKFEHLTPLRGGLELNAVQRLLVAQTGRGTMLFRFPYEDGMGPRTTADARSMSLLAQKGYITVLGQIDSSDWKPSTPQQIVDRVFAQLKDIGGNVILLHDGGGNRAATVAAVPLLIHRLRAEGYQLVSLPEMLGMSRDALMPRETGPRTLFEQITFGFVTQFWSGLNWIFWGAILLGPVRMTVFAALALTRRRRPSYRSYRPSVAVAIPAYNEEAVIVKTVRSVLASDYPGLEVIVVDDGSADATYSRVTEAYPPGGPVTVVRQANGGKSRALGTAYGLVRAEIVVAIDSDTLLAPDAIGKLVEPFHDPRVGAVAGNVKVGNRDRLLTRFQAVEYITAQNIDRRAAEVYGGVMVVPGAIGAWRASAVRAVGLYSSDTLTEDADLTVALQRAGYRIACRTDAFSYTEAPEDVKAFLAQRLRWTLGMMQVGWKHRGAIRELRPVGLISLIDLLVFGVLLGLLAPVADLVFLNVALRYVVDLVVGRGGPAQPYPAMVMASYLVLPLADLAVAALAFRMERRETYRLLLLVPIQRFCYRQLLYFTVYRAVLRSISGQLASWGKLVRLGTVQLPGREEEARPDAAPVGPVLPAQAIAVPVHAAAPARRRKEATPAS
ncbi:glycosyltransferase [Solirhodobacter olei]|uniref:glycosyltransferase n=1 Tax=Solirhodobacter olei TaxID=2493082 RepID=UPI000FD9E9A2|nr:glycosyltransferase [Solirhodobacter olei]